MVIINNSPISQDEYIKLLEDYIDSNNNNSNKKDSIIQNSVISQIISKTTSNPKQCLLNMPTHGWENLITEIIKINPFSYKNSNNIQHPIDFGFNLLWGKLFIKNQQYIKKEEFVLRMQKLYKDVENLLGRDDKFDETSSIEWLKNKLADVYSHGNIFSDLLLVLGNKENRANGTTSKQASGEKVKPLDRFYLLSGEQLKSTLKEQLQSFNNILVQIIDFVSSKSYSSIFGNLLSVLQLIYSTFIRDCISIGLELKNHGENSTLLQVLHKRTLKFHKDLGNCCNKFCLSAIRPATSIIPWMNLPYNGQFVYGRINELDLVQYPEPVERVNDDYGSGIVNCQDNSSSENVFKTFKVSPHYFSSNHASGHIDCVSGYYPIWETFCSSSDLINFNIIKGGGNEFINSYKIKLHLSSMYQGDSHCKVKIGESGPVQTIDLNKDLSNDLINFQVMNFKILYNVDLPYGVKEFTSNDEIVSKSDFLSHQKILNFRIFDACNIVLNSIDITLE